MHAQSLQSCLTLCDPVDCSLPGSSVLGIFQARILEWVKMNLHVYYIELVFLLREKDYIRNSPARNKQKS